MPNGRFQLPGQVNIGCHHTPAPFATPAQLGVNTANGGQLFTFGGLTKLEYAAIHLNGDVELAERVLAECQKREQRTDADSTSTLPTE